MTTPSAVDDAEVSALEKQLTAFPDTEWDRGAAWKIANRLLALLRRRTAGADASLAKEVFDKFSAFGYPTADAQHSQLSTAAYQWLQRAAAPPAAGDSA